MKRLPVWTILLCLTLPVIISLMSACRTTASERQEIRQETRIKERTEDRMERRRN